MAADLAAQEDGAALVEAALVLPILLVLVLGLADLSLYFWNLNLAGKAVQLGARRAVVSSPVAIGPGLEPADSAEYWDGLDPGTWCTSGPDDACPRFVVSCDLAAGCRCTGTACRFTFAAGRLGPILTAMRAVLPTLRPENLRISYATNGTGYVGRPPPIPVDVGVSLVGLRYDPLFLGGIFGSAMPLSASAVLPGESLLSR